MGSRTERLVQRRRVSVDTAECRFARIASAAVSVDELVKEAELWLFDRRHLLPGDRVLRDASRVAFSAIEAASLEAVRTQVDGPRKLLAAVYAKRRGRTGGTVLEWLRTAPAEHGSAGLNEATEKMAFLKSLGVDGWTLGAISSARLRAYSQAVVNRPLSETKKLSDETQLLEVACFLRATLLDLTDAAIYMAGRRVCDLTRHATARVQITQARSAFELRERHEQIRLLLYAEGRTSDQKIEALKQLVPAEIGNAITSRAALVRQALIDDDIRVTALLNAFADLDIKGDETQRPLRQILALRDLQASGAKELPRKARPTPTAIASMLVAKPVSARSQNECRSWCLAASTPPPASRPRSSARRGRRGA